MELSKPGMAVKLFKYVVLRPIFSFLLTFALVGAVTLAPRRLELAAFYSFTFPLLLVVIVLVNGPFVGAAIHKFRLPEAIKVNHALEHGTIHFLRQRYGRRFKIGGRALDQGFRINGVNSPEHLGSAFNELREHLARGDTRAVVSRRCGSNIVSAQALASILLVASAAAVLLLGLGQNATIVVLLGNAVAYLTLRYPLGNWAQRHFFVSTAFADASIHSINRVKPDSLIERRPAYFVRTLIQWQAIGGEKPNQRMQATAGAAPGSAEGGHRVDAHRA